MKFSSTFALGHASRMLVAACAVTLLNPLHAQQEQVQRELVVCADRDNLPFSNEQEQGFENKIARLIAVELNATLRYAWNPQPRGFRPRHLGEGRCDAVMGAVEGLPGISVTQPYYSSSYVFVAKRERKLSFHDLDDPQFRSLKLGLEAIGAEGSNTPPARALASRGITANVIGYSMWSHAADSASRAQMVDAVMKGDIDAALMWGPFAGYFGKQHGERVTLEPILEDPRQPDVPFAYAISLGVRSGNDALLAALQDVLLRKQSEIQQILKQFGVPLVSVRRGSSRPLADNGTNQSFLK